MISLDDVVFSIVFYTFSLILSKVTFMVFDKFSDSIPMLCLRSITLFPLFYKIKRFFRTLQDSSLSLTI